MEDFYTALWKLSRLEATQEQRDLVQSQRNQMGLSYVQNELKRILDIPSFEVGDEVSFEEKTYRVCSISPDGKSWPQNFSPAFYVQVEKDGQRSLALKSDVKLLKRSPRQQASFFTH